MSSSLYTAVCNKLFKGFINNCHMNWARNDVLFEAKSFLTSWFLGTKSRTCLDIYLRQALFMITFTEPQQGKQCRTIRRVQPTRYYVSQFIISVRRCTCFRRVFRPSSGAQNCTYSDRHLSDRYCCLLLAWPGRQQVAVTVWQMPGAVCTVLSSWWWTENPSETCRASYRNE